MSSRNDFRDWSRRRVLHSAVGAALGAACARPLAAAAGEAEKVVKNGRIKQSLVHWCFSQYWGVEEMARIARDLGCSSIELVDPEHWPVLKRHGLTCAIAGIKISPGPAFATGMNNPKHQDRVVQATRDAIDACAANGVANVISFTGMRDGIPDDIGMRNCVEGYKKLMAQAEAKKVNVCLEMLNTRDSSHPMKGHPGYQGDHTEYCVEIIRRIREYKDLIAHVHTAGNPGRGELDDKQEINYPAVMQALVDIGYQGYVGQEFIPTRDPLAGLKEAVARCDV